MSPADPSRLPRCADTARDRQDPMLGSAPPVLRWLLIEHPGPWRLTAMTSHTLEGPVSRAIQEAAAAHRARPVLIRRHGRQVRRRHLRWGLVDSLSGRALWGTWTVAEDLRAAVAALASPSARWARSAPLLLVCTHGTHDVCCSVRGRPVASALQLHWASETWECSHLGGDRFAANVAVLPEGVLYGNLDESSAVPVIARHLDGHITPEHLRGMSSYSPPMQAAVGYVLSCRPSLPFRDVTAHGLTRLSEDAWRAVVRVVDDPPAVLTLKVTRAWQQPARLTCRAAAPTDAATFTVVEAFSDVSAG
jgi:hypothetical protein